MSIESIEEYAKQLGIPLDGEDLARLERNQQQLLARTEKVKSLLPPEEFLLWRLGLYTLVFWVHYVTGASPRAFLELLGQHLDQHATAVARVFFGDAIRQGDQP